ncbi:MAG: GNAT family N-acetyltransferase [Spirochaetes bacterium]|jgi:RimJ/RimL family protein N-acetyltransferase|nr:GNAT family N-acetyltransferase [Spirochaetota bacterium]
MNAATGYDRLAWSDDFVTLEDQPYRKERLIRPSLVSLVVPMSDRPVSIEPVTLDHAEAIQALASHPDVVATTNLPDPYPENGAQTWISHVRPRHEAGDEFAFVVKDGDTVVGVTGLVNVTEVEAEIGYWIGRPYWERGYATEGVRQTIQWVFENTGIRRIYARPLQDNPASRRVLEKLRFTEGGEEVHEHPKWSEEDLVVRYTLQIEEWQTDG